MCTSESSSLTDEQKLFYEKNGYILIKNNLNPEFLDELRQRFEDLCEGTAQNHGVSIVKDPVLKKRGISGQYAVNKDLHYFPFRPANKIVTAWTAMERLDEKNGCLHVIPGSHNGPLYNHEYPEGNKHKLYHEVTGMNHLPKLHVIMEKGDTIFFHSLLLHGSGPNFTKGFRKAISCHYADSNCTFMDINYGRMAKEIEDMEETKTGVPLNIQLKIRNHIPNGNLYIYRETKGQLIQTQSCVEESVPNKPDTTESTVSMESTFLDVPSTSTDINYFKARSRLIRGNPGALQQFYSNL
ncbi:phytanoyl-CoA dioxygenase, peroxisomal isoform X2 [Leptinotarsa decemlineata]|uniref:phytanoyl-CoA dioxygenase, peroxisomal isoform X2 n=1 Tax=Leptinotarsa decemlineata TaxID=7539 RepID=UPI003D30798A